MSSLELEPNVPLNQSREIIFVLAHIDELFNILLIGSRLRDRLKAIDPRLTWNELSSTERGALIAAHALCFN